MAEFYYKSFQKASEYILHNYNEHIQEYLKENVHPHFMKHMCKDSNCNDPKFVLGLYVKGSNNKFVESGVKGEVLVNGQSLVMVFKMLAQK